MRKTEKNEKTNAKKVNKRQTLNRMTKSTQKKKI